eukprot:TRINITY_DN44209_c0_g1_i1.p1 TRINITY_DN44209_c0_g1~~TRINITY_DN44209_c0_g1_i1.p1  ORF type:complete len:374 (-),score=52.13 TRINITY_DN44209_c0_g1_i1:125-1246(-)
MVATLDAMETDRGVKRPLSDHGALPPTSRARYCSTSSVACRCCGPMPQAPVGFHMAAQLLPELWLAEDPACMPTASAESVAARLHTALGHVNLHLLLGSDAWTAARAAESPTGNISLVFATKVLRVIPTDSCCGFRSEALDVAWLCQTHPSAIVDRHLSLPLAGAVLRRRTGTPYEALVHARPEGSVPLDDVFRAFAAAHSEAARRGVDDGFGTTACCCPEFRASGACGHAQALRSLVLQAARLSRRFQARYGRRHGRFHADAILVRADGTLTVEGPAGHSRTSCDLDDFVYSLRAILSPECASQLTVAFSKAWGALMAMSPCIVGDVPAALPEERRANAELLAALRSLAPSLLEPGGCLLGGGGGLHSNGGW